MNTRYVAAICISLVAAMALVPSTFAQHKSAKACAAEEGEQGGKASGR